MKAPSSIRLGREDDAARVPEIDRAAAMLYAPWGLTDALMESTTPLLRVERAIRAGTLLVATDADDRAVGYALFSFVDGDAHLDELAVDPAHGRRGLGTALVEDVVARAEDAARVTLVTLDFVPFCAPFYERRGFTRLDSDALTPRLRSLVEPDVDDGRIAMARLIAR